MSYQYYVTNNQPTGAWFYDGGLVDFSENRNNILNEAVTSVSPIVAGGRGGVISSNAHNLLIPPPYNYRLGREKQAFSLEIWFRLHNPSPISIFEHPSGDGLSWDGSHIVFTQMYDGEVQSKISYKLFDWRKVHHLVLVRTPEKNSLYINGFIVSEVDTPDLPYSSNVDYSGMYLGRGAGTITFEYPAVYDHALTAFNVLLHYEQGRKVEPVDSIIGNYGGSAIEFVDDLASIIFEFDSDWTQGQYEIPPINDEVYLNTNWKIGFVLTDPTDGVLGGSKIEWTAVGNIVIEVSTDAEQTWKPCRNGKTIPGIAYQTPAIDFPVTIRVRPGTGGFLESLSIKVYDDKNIISTGGIAQTVIVDPAHLSSSYYHPIDDSDQMGLHLEGGRIQIEPTNPIESVELWVKLNDITKPTTIFSRGGTTLFWDGTRFIQGAGLFTYMNTVPLSDQTLLVGEWYQIVINSAASSTPFLVNAPSSGDFNLGFVGMYNTALTDGSLVSLYNDYYGKSSLRISSNANLSVKDAEISVRLSTHDWAVISS